VQKYNIKIRRVQRKKQKPKASYTGALMKFHCELREGLIKSGRNLPHYDQKWGRFKPDCRFNVDQVPLPFAIDRKTTYHEAPADPVERRGQRVWVNQPSGGLEKRQCTLQVCFSPVGDNIRIAIIFRGTGKRISAQEKASYHPAVDVYWQECAWVDRKVALDWLERTFKPAVADKEFLLFCDNLDAQTHVDFREKVKEYGGFPRYGPPGLTDAWQPVDSGHGQLLKVLTGKVQQNWLEMDENIEQWSGNTDTNYTAMERRILITQWVGEAYIQLQDTKYQTFRWRCFERTGCLITADGSDDDKIKPEDMPHYVVPASLPLVCDNAMEEVIPTAEPIPADDVLGEDQSDYVTVQEEEENLEMDKEEHRDMDHDLVGRKIRMLYAEEGGWFVGRVTWYNAEMKKLRVYFENDDSDDYIQIDEIDGHEIILLE
jgi:hypothetical protein